MKGIFIATAFIAGSALSTGVFSQTYMPDVAKATRQESPKLLDTIVVSGKAAGPGLWQVYKDDSHDLWIMGTLSPLPAGIEWDAAAVRALVSQADEVLWGPGYSVNVKSNLFQQAMLGFGYLRAQKNPEGKSLQEVLPPALYARWAAVKSKYMPRNSSVERKRPLVAAEELLDAAIASARLSRKPIVRPALESTIEAGGIRTTTPRFEVKLTNAAAKAALSDLRSSRLDDEKCLEATLDAVENDVPRMVSNANAWSRGEIDHISFASLARRNALCSEAMLSPSFSEKYGLPDIRTSIANTWLQQAQTALSSNTVTVAFVPMEQLVGPDNYLDRLRALGYTVNDP